MHYSNALKETDYAIISLKEEIVKYILTLALECKGSLGGIQSSIERVLDEAADRAKTFNESIALDNIELVASDEIFQSGKPVLVGVNPQSTYVYLMENSEKRDGIAWSMAYYELQQTQSLNNLTVSVTDGGTGMKKGIKDVFENIEEQYDVFHLEMKFGKAISKLSAVASSFSPRNCTCHFRNIQLEHTFYPSCLILSFQDFRHGIFVVAVFLHIYKHEPN